MTALGENPVCIGRMIDQRLLKTHKCTVSIETRFSRVTPAPLPGGYGVCEPPDPIPNSAVKPDSADGTIAQAMEE